MRLIDADALRTSIRESIEECRKWANEIHDGEMYARVSQSIGTFVECSLRIKNAPTVEPIKVGDVCKDCWRDGGNAVDVVRCKDCKFYHKADRGHPDTDWCKRLICGTIKPDFFCADGERRET